MLNWRIEQGVIRELSDDDCNFILPWGIETADSSGFFSLERHIGYRHSREREEYIADEKSSRAKILCSMPEGGWQLDLDDRLEAGNAVVRTASLVSLEDTILMDFVMRFRFRKDMFQSAEIAGLMLIHGASDVYHQYPVRTARLNGKNFSICIEVEEASCAGVMAPNLYVRDHANEWVIHARMVPMQVHKEVIKICNKWAGTRPLPSWAASAMLRVPGLHKFLSYRNERKPYPRIVRRLFNPNAFPMAILPKGNSLFWKVRMTVV